MMAENDDQQLPPAPQTAQPQVQAAPAGAPAAQTRPVARAGNSAWAPLPKAAVISASCALSLMFVAFLWVIFYPDAAGVMSFGVSVEGKPLAGMSRDEAINALARMPDMHVPADLKLRAGGKPFLYSLKDIKYDANMQSAVDRAWSIGRNGGLVRKIEERIVAAASHLNFKVAAAYDAKPLPLLIDMLNEKIGVLPINARIDWDGPSILPHKIGRGVDKKAALDLIKKSLVFYRGEELELPIGDLQPRTTVKDLEGIDLKNPLSKYSTKYDEGVVGRSKNLKKIADILTGVEIKPGETFSYNAIVGNRSEEAGFYPAPEIVNGRMVVGFGGGACQVSTTVFNSALLADLDGFDWTPHSIKSHYANPGRDATVYYGQLDLKFKNPHKSSIFMRATSEKGVLTVYMYSRFKLPYSIELSSKWWNVHKLDDEEKVNPDLKPGERKVVSSGGAAMNAALYRTYVYTDGRKAEKQLFPLGRRSIVYRGAKKIIEVGPDEVAGPAPDKDKRKTTGKDAAIPEF